jgi:hypothetical protein
VTINSRQTWDDHLGDLRVADKSIDQQLVENRSFMTCNIVLGSLGGAVGVAVVVVVRSGEAFFLLSGTNVPAEVALRYFPPSGKLFPDLRSLVSGLENLSVSLFLSLSLSLVAVVFVALLLFGMEFAPICFFPW